MSQSLYQATRDWILEENSIRSAVLFGSNATESSDGTFSDRWSDFDIHLVTSNPTALAKVDWKNALPSEKYLMQCMRPATGGVQKLTVLFESGQIDLIIVPAFKLRLAKFGLALGLEQFNRELRTGLNEIHTCIQGGYRFLKGEKSWGGFYRNVATRMSGVRLHNDAVIELANRAMVDTVWIRQKLSRGELSAGQHLLHRSLAEINFRLIRELKLRKGEPLPSFGLGRHVERNLSPEELEWVRVDTRCVGDDLMLAVERSSQGLESLMRELDPTWKVPVSPNLS